MEENMCTAHDRRWERERMETVAFNTICKDERRWSIALCAIEVTGVAERVEGAESPAVPWVKTRLCTFAGSGVQPLYGGALRGPGISAVS
jgi:hypothetical protein